MDYNSNDLKTNKQKEANCLAYSGAINKRRDTEGRERCATARPSHHTHTHTPDTQIGIK